MCNIVSLFIVNKTNTYPAKKKKPYVQDAEMRQVYIYL